MNRREFSKLVLEHINVLIEENGNMCPLGLACQLVGNECRTGDADTRVPLPSNAAIKLDLNYFYAAGVAHGWDAAECGDLMCNDFFVNGRRFGARVKRILDLRLVSHHD